MECDKRIGGNARLHPRLSGAVYRFSGAAVWRLDRRGRSLKHLIELMAELEAEWFGFQSATESIDKTRLGGKLDRT